MTKLPPMSQSFIDQLTRGLSPEDRNQLEDVIDYLGSHAAPGASGRMAEGSVAALLNKQSPAVRNAFSQISELLETPRMEPFIDKWSEAQNASAMGLDPDAAVQVKAALDGSEVASRLQGRMGTDADRPDEPPSMRDQIEAAVSYQQNRGE